MKDEFFQRGSMESGNGLNARFWEDTWLGDEPLSVQYPSLYGIVNHPNVSVDHVMSATPLNIGFRRALNGDKWDRWVHLVTRLMGVNLSDNNDAFRWSLTTSGQFSVKSMYLDLLDNPAGDFKKYI